MLTFMLFKNRLNTLSLGQVAGIIVLRKLCCCAVADTLLHVLACATLTSSGTSEVLAVIQLPRRHVDMQTVSLQSRFEVYVLQISFEAHLSVL
jgi:hypothetical protein